MASKLGIMSFFKRYRHSDRFRVASQQNIALLIWMSIAMLSLVFFFQLSSWVNPTGMMQILDEEIIQWIGSHLRSPEWDFLFVDLSSLGSMAIVITICVISMFLFILSRDPLAATHLLLVALGGFKISSWAKALIARPRPDVIPKLIQVGGNSFPSGHAVTAATLYFTLAILASRHFTTLSARITLFGLAALLVTTVAFSRVYLGVHYPSDVISGALLGSAWALFMGGLFSKRHFFNHKA
jgi:undecaprenyl-diphosphatase